MEWAKLELRKAAVLRKEVDLAIRLVSAAVENDNQQQVEDLMDSIQYRIDQIEEFYAQNESDERAILFEKQRLRLRRTLQNLQPPPESVPSVAAPSENLSPSPKRSKDVTSRQQKYALRNPGSPKPEKNRNREKTPEKIFERDSMRKMHIGELEGSPSSEHMDDDKSHDSSALTLNTSQKKKKKKRQPTYAWESATEENNPKNIVREERICTAEYGSFIPTSTPGIYMAEEDEYSTSEVGDPAASEKTMSGYPSTHLDVQVVLSPAEFEAYVLRKRNVTKKTSGSKNAILSAKNQAETSKYSNYLSKQSNYLSTQTPYMDPKRIKWDLCRPKQRDKWLHPKGFL